MPNNYNFTVVILHTDYVKLHGYLTSHTKHPQQATVIEIRGDGAHTRFSLGQKVQVDMTLTPLIGGVAQAAYTP